MFSRGKYATVNYTASNGGRANGVAMKTEETKKNEQRRTKLQKKKKRKKKKEKKKRKKRDGEEREEGFVYANREPRRSHFNQSSIADAANLRGGTRIPTAVGLHFRQTSLIACEYATTNAARDRCSLICCDYR